MSVTLTQSTSAAFPDRPAGLGAGLRVAMTAGGDGAILDLPLGQGHPRLHARLALRLLDAGGGEVTLLSGLNDGGDTVWRLDLLPDSHRVALWLLNGQTLLADLPGPPILPHWMVIQAAINDPDRHVALYLNGLVTAEADGSLESVVTHAVRCGAFHKHPDAAGELHLDELTLSTEAPGVIAVQPSTDHADDPARWLVLYNTDSPDSLHFAQALHDRRGVPYANLLGLALGQDETLNYAGFQSLASKINDYLAHHPTGQHLLGVLLAHGTPGYADTPIGVEPLASLLASPSLVPGAVLNPLFADTDDPARPAVHNLQGLRLTARIDGPTLDDSLALLDRSDAIAALPIGSTAQPPAQPGDDAVVFIDPYTDSGPLTDPIADPIVAWANSRQARGCRLPVRLSADVRPTTDTGFTAIDHDGFAWLWSNSSGPSSPAFFAQPAGRRAALIQLEHAHATASTLRAADPTQWIGRALHAGYAAAIGSSRPCSLGLLPAIRPFFAALRRGWTVAEACFVASPFLREAFALIGDPFLRPTTPAHGWDIIGPLASPMDLRDDSPALAVRETHRSLVIPADARPATDADACYLLRRTDASGRSVLSTVIPRVALAQDPSLASTPPLAPLWPIEPDWRPATTSHGIVLALLFDRPLAEIGARRVEALSQPEVGEPSLLAVVDLATPSARRSSPALRHRLAIRVPPPLAPTRYRFRLIGPASPSAPNDDGYVIDTPLSQLVLPAAPSLPAPTPL